MLTRQVIGKNKFLLKNLPINQKEIIIKAFNQFLKDYKEKEFFIFEKSIKKLLSRNSPP